MINTTALFLPHVKTAAWDIPALEPAAWDTPISPMHKQIAEAKDNYYTAAGNTGATLYGGLIGGNLGFGAGILSNFLPVKDETKTEEEVALIKQRRLILATALGTGMGGLYGMGKNLLARHNDHLDLTELHKLNIEKLKLEAQAARS